MCGIGAFQIINNEVSPAKVARVLARLLQARGTDASGVAWHDNGNTWVNKSNVAGEVLARSLGNDVGNVTRHGFPDGWTDGQADSHRYKQMGNAVAVPVVQWIIDRLVK